KLKLGTCDSAALWMRQTPGYKIKNEAIFNTEYSDWAPAYEDKTNMVFTSDRPSDAPDVDDRTGNNWFKLYEFSMPGKEIKELSVATENSDIFNDSYHIGPVAFNN